jgi:hypothetical protein
MYINESILVHISIVIHQHWQVPHQAKLCDWQWVLYGWLYFIVQITEQILNLNSERDIGDTKGVACGRGWVRVYPDWPRRQWKTSFSCKFPPVLQIQCMWCFAGSKGQLRSWRPMCVTFSDSQKTWTVKYPIITMPSHFIQGWEAPLSN